MISRTNRRAVVLMIAAMACYVSNDTLVKLTLQAFPAGQVLTLRGFVGTLLLATVFWRHMSTAGGLKAHLHPLLAVRCVLEIATATTSVLALSQASLAVVSAIMMTAPLLVIAASMTLGWDRPHPRLVLGVVLGLSGALLVLRPAPQSSAAGIALSCLCAMSLAARDLVTRRLPSSMSSSVVAAFTTCSVCAAGPVFGWLTSECWVSLSRSETLAIAAAAVSIGLGNYALISACRGADLAVVTPFRYSSIVWACLVAFFVWGDVPDAKIMIGVAIIVIAGVLTLRTAVRR